MTKLLLASAGIAAMTLATPATAQWYPRNYNYAISPDAAVNRCANSVQRRLGYRRGARVLDITQVRPRGAHLRVRGIASEGARYRYGRAYRSNVQFTCDVDRRGRIGNLSFSRW